MVNGKGKRKAGSLPEVKGKSQKVSGGGARRQIHLNGLPGATSKKAVKAFVASSSSEEEGEEEEEEEDEEEEEEEGDEGEEGNAVVHREEVMFRTLVDAAPSVSGGSTKHSKRKKSSEEGDFVLPVEQKTIEDYMKPGGDRYQGASSPAEATSSAAVAVVRTPVRRRGGDTKIAASFFSDESKRSRYVEYGKAIAAAAWKVLMPIAPFYPKDGFSSLVQMKLHSLYKLSHPSFANAWLGNVEGVDLAGFTWRNFRDTRINLMHTLGTKLVSLFDITQKPKTPKAKKNKRSTPSPEALVDTERKQKWTSSAGSGLLQRLANPYSRQDWEAWECFVRFTFKLSKEKPFLECVTAEMEAFCLIIAVYYCKGWDFDEDEPMLCVHSNISASLTCLLHVSPRPARPGSQTGGVAAAGVDASGVAPAESVAPAADGEGSTSITWPDPVSDVWADVADGADSVGRQWSHIRALPSLTPEQTASRLKILTEFCGRPRCYEDVKVASDQYVERQLAVEEASSDVSLVQPASWTGITHATIMAKVLLAEVDL